MSRVGRTCDRACLVLNDQAHIAPLQLKEVNRWQKLELVIRISKDQQGSAIMNLKYEYHRLAGWRIALRGAKAKPGRALRK